MYKNSFFVFAYYSYKDPVFQSAVLPYIMGLSNGDVKIILLTFEHSKYVWGQSELEELNKTLKSNHIFWYRSKWRSGKFKLIKKGIDFVSSIILSIKIIRKHKPKIIYSEAFPGAIIGYHLSKWFRIPHMVHSFEPHTEYMVEAGVWSKSDWEAKLLAKYEEKIALQAHTIMTATQAMIDRLRKLGNKANIYRVPSCVDLDLFKFNKEHRLKKRRELGYKDDHIVIVYLGKFGGMYMDKEIFDFFSICQRVSDDFRFLIISQDSHELINGLKVDTSLKPERIKVLSLERNSIPSFLCACDFGFVPVRQNPSKRYCSPIKDGEYWACGLPILIFDGISDDYLLAQEYKIGIRIKDTSESSFARTAEQVLNWRSNDNFEKVRSNCISFVDRDRNVKVYQKLYRDVINSVK